MITSDYFAGYFNKKLAMFEARVRFSRRVSISSESKVHSPQEIDCPDVSIVNRGSAEGDGNEITCFLVIESIAGCMRINADGLLKEIKNDGS